MEIICGQLVGWILRSFKAKKKKKENRVGLVENTGYYYSQLTADLQAIECCYKTVPVQQKN